MYFTEFDNIIMRLSDGSADASECHGHLLGLLCATGDDAVSQWLDALIAAAPSDNALAADAREELSAIGKRCAAQLAEGNLDYALMVPDDDVELAARTTALAHWCQGFLYGMAQGGVKSFSGLPGECPEILADLSTLTSAVAEDASEDSERAFFEVAEYVRIGSQLIYEELRAANRTATNVSH
ncbi:MAG: UPF0149 family protein [Gammaproteobacteria bacterium]|nr:UPF0149 family protein [Gammaproteobacteria bacterium]